MSDVIVRVALTNESDFIPVTLAPQLPMLDPKKLGYQVLLGWFGDVLADPEMDETGVRFYAQQDGNRIAITDRSLATAEDLDGPLAKDFARLQQALFDVRPVSPAERLIFNRLNPPIANHDGMLYRVTTEDGAAKLVWCWGFQRRTNEGRVRQCPHADCSGLFVDALGAAETCPHCQKPLVMAIARFEEPSAARPVRQRSRKPVGAITATLILTTLGAGTYWYAATAPTEISADEPQIARLDPQALQGAAGSENNQTERVILPGSEDATPRKNVRRKNPSTDIAAKSPTESLPKLPNPMPGVTASPAEGAGPLALPMPDEPRDLKPLISQAPEFKPLKVPEIPGTSTTPTASLPAAKQPTSTPSPLPTLPLPDAPGTSPVQLSPTIEKTGPETSTADSPTNPPRNPTADEVVTTPTPRKTLGSLTWVQDYLAGYQQASQEQRRLLMVFREASDADSTESGISGLANADIEPLLASYIRVSLTVSATVPGMSNEAAPTRLLAHRSFRHLNGKAGLVVIDLTTPGSVNYGRVVSALPLPENGRLELDTLRQLLQLPTGTIGQRTLALTIRTSMPQGNFAAGEPHPVLMSLASQSARLMAQNEQAGAFEQESRSAKIVEAFGAEARSRELHFATSGATTVQDAANQAVQSWLQNPDDVSILSQPATAFGIELFQSPTTQRWYASGVIVTR